jgi:putative CocE/NonD family hydrolase
MLRRWFPGGSINSRSIFKLTIDLWSTSNVFLKGHRIRVEIASSNFPHFNRNLNTGKSANMESAMQTATNTILHDAEHPSAIMLPLVPSEDK